MISREVVETKYVYLYLGEDWDSHGYNDPVKFQYEDEGEDIKFWVPETSLQNKKLVGVLKNFTHKGKFITGWREKESQEYVPLRSIRITKSMLEAVLAHAKENEKK